jgi:sugar phosphate isomerase/epimerase
MTSTVLLGTVALEPNRWGMVDASRRATIDLAAWLPAVADAGFDGVELWEDHLDDAVVAGPLPITVLNTYVSFDEPDDTARKTVAERVAHCHASAVKFNVGHDVDAVDDYATRLVAFCDALPPTTRALCECHAGTAAEDPAFAARLLDAAGPPERVGAIVHTHESADHVRARFAAYGERIVHVHVNHLDRAATAPRLRDMRPELVAEVGLLRDLGFDGTWTIEFVHGTSTADDRPDQLIDAAVDDLHVLREVIDG